MIRNVIFNVPISFQTKNLDKRSEIENLGEEMKNNEATRNRLETDLRVKDNKLEQLTVNHFAISSTAIVYINCPFRL